MSVVGSTNLIPRGILRAVLASWLIIALLCGYAWGLEWVVR